MTKGIWFLPNANGGEPSGPHSTEEISALLKSSELSLLDFAWSPEKSESTWTRLLDHPEFQSLVPPLPRVPTPKRFSQGLSKGREHIWREPKAKHTLNENDYRRFPRAPLKSEAYLHNQKHLSKGICLDISEMGIQFTSNQELSFSIGEEVILILRDSPEIGTTSIPSVIIRHESKSNRHEYGIRFLRLNPQLRQKIAKYVATSLGKPSQQSHVA